jgi:hypothetical protein
MTNFKLSTFYSVVPSSSSTKKDSSRSNSSGIVPSPRSRLDALRDQTFVQKIEILFVRGSHVVPHLQSALPLISVNTTSKSSPKISYFPSFISQSS